MGVHRPGRRLRRAGDLPAGEILLLPAGLSAVDAVTPGSSGVAAYFGLAHASFAAGESVLMRGTADSIGIMMVQLAARGGASAVAVTTSSAERGDRLRTLGTTCVLDRAGQGSQDGPPGYDVIIDIAADADMPSLFSRLNPNGRIVVAATVCPLPVSSQPAERHGLARPVEVVPTVMPPAQGWEAPYDPPSTFIAAVLGSP